MNKFIEVRKIDQIAKNILKKRYLKPNEKTWEDIVDRVINYIVPNKTKRKDDIRDMILHRYFIPNSPCLVNAGTKSNGLSACFVVDFTDSILGIYKTKLDFALIAKKGGGCGTSLSKIRPENSTVAGSTHGYAGGPIKFFDTICHDMEAMTQSGFREMAIMGALSVYHPDIIKFITAKSIEGKMKNANISVMVDDHFMEMVENDREYWTIFDDKKYNKYKARDIFNLIVEHAWKNGEPGLLFYDRINDSPYKYTGQIINSTNPCLTGDMELLTEDGYIQLKNLENKEINIINKNGNLSPSKIWKSGCKDVVELNLSNNTKIRCTPNHVFMDVDGNPIIASETKSKQLMPFLQYPKLNQIINTSPYVKSIKDIGKQEVYDFSEPITHWGIVNGIITHNCGELPLPSNGVCNLGSLDITKFMDKNNNIDWNSFEYAIKLSIEFLDKTIDVNSFPTEEISEWVKRNRPIGLGIMGLADYFLAKEIVYGSNDSLIELDNIMSFLQKTAEDKSIELGQQYGVPVECEKLPVPRRNITTLAIAPTGSIALLSGCSNGIEPIFSELTKRKDKTGEYNMYHPLHDKPYFRCAVSSNGAKEVSWKEHILIQSIAQRYVDSGISKCIEKGTLIATNKGLIKIENFSNIIEDDSFISIENDGFITNTNKVIKHYKAGLQDSTKIILDNGASLTGATNSHRILTTEGWKILREIKVGDVVLGKLTESHGMGGEKFDWKSEFNTNSNHINIPNYMTDDFAEFLGMITSDGHITESTGFVGISCKNIDVEKEFDKITYSIFNIHPKQTLDKRNGVKSLYITSRNLARFIISLIGNGAYYKKVPKEILMGNKNEKLSYLKGISLDGYRVNTKRRKEFALCVYGGMSKELAYGIAEVCRSFGIPKVYQGYKKVKGFGTEYTVVISNELQKIIKCIELHKNIPPTFIDYKVYVPKNIIENKKVPLNHKGYFALKSLQSRKNEFCFSQTARILGFETDILAYKVTKTESVGFKELFDIEVENSHDYIVNGIISHNTINFPNKIHKDTIGDAFMYAWKTGTIKGITIYRNGSREVEVLSPKNIKDDKCPICDGDLIKESGCKHCSKCDFSVCTIG